MKTLAFAIRNAKEMLRDIELGVRDWVSSYRSFAFVADSIEYSGGFI